MKKYTINDLATILDLDEVVKEDLRKNFDNFDEELKYEIVKTLWDGVFELKSKLAKLKYEQFLIEIEAGKRELMTNLYEEATKAVWQDFEDILAGKTQDSEQLEEIRTKLKLPISSSPPSQKS